MDKIELGPDESIILRDNEVLSDVEVSGLHESQAILADTVEFYEDANFRHCEIYAKKVVCHGNTTLNYTVVHGDIEIEDGCYRWKNALCERPRHHICYLLDALRRILRQLWAGSAAIVCPENYLGGGWEPGACDGCRAREGCRETVVLP